MQTSAEIGELATALSKARALFTAAVKDRSAIIPGKGGKPGFEYKYADLPMVLQSCMEHLNANGLTVVQGTAPHDAGIEITSRLLHSSGQWLENSVVMPVAGTWRDGSMDGPPNAQSVASAITFGRRYGLTALLGIAADDDDDGAAASGHDGKGNNHAPSGPRSPANDRTAPTSRSEPSRPAQATPASGNGHSSAWSEFKGAFMADLGRLGLRYIDVAAYLEANRRLRPSAMTGEQAQTLVEWLRGSGEGKVLAWLNTRPTGDKGFDEPGEKYDYAAAEKAALAGDLP